MSVNGGKLADDKSRLSMERSSVAAFYAGRSILVTGATGFLGKVLLEKLLYSCPDVREVFLLMRPKRDKTIDDRLREMLEIPLFDRLRKERPSSFEKLIPVHGDTNVEGLALPPIERQTLIDRVSVIFHVAAYVRFSGNLKKDVTCNTRGTRDVCILAGSMKKLVALLHVSTAYAQCDKPEVEEIMYPPLCDWRSAIRAMETLDEDVLQIFTRKYIDQMPNTYTFSKRLAEQVINDYAKDLPCAIFRPSIVISSIEEPMEGWLDNFNGPVSMLVGGGKGIMRVFRGNANAASDFVPIDVGIKIMLLAAWKRGLTTVTRDPSVHVYNGSSNQLRRIVNRELMTMGFRQNAVTPVEGIIWYPWVISTASEPLYYALTLLLHLLPACIIDGVLKMTGRKPMLLKIQRNIYTVMMVLSHFLHNEWSFNNSKMLDILTVEVPPCERNIFGFDFSSFYPDHYFRNCLLGAKRYLLKEDMSRVEAAKKHYDRMEMIDRVFRVLAVLLLMWIFVKSGLCSYLFDAIRSIGDGSLFLKL